LALMLDHGPLYRSGGIVLNRSLRCIRITVGLAALAIMVAGCADSRMAANNATSNSAAGAQAPSEAPYHTAYGITSDGPTTDLYTELFGSSPRDNGNAAVAATAAPTAQQGQPVTAAAPPQQVQPATASATNRQVQRTTASAANRQVQPAPAPLANTQVAQQPAAPQPPSEPDTPTAYGISSNGPTTDLYTELFGPRRRDGQ
jgi:hypothetical protein